MNASRRLLTGRRLLLFGGGVSALGLSVTYWQSSQSRDRPLIGDKDHGSVPNAASFPTPLSRAAQLQRLQNTEYDVLIIGGGATGSGCALDSASRGLKTAMIEREDFASGTSSRSTKLVHGGVRYLEKAFKELDYEQYKLVREALHERKTFLHIAPHLSFSLPIMVPLYRWWQAPYFWIGTKLYDWLAGGENMESSYFLTRGKALEAFPMLKPDKLIGAIIYYDGQHNDARMNVSLALSAADQGATVANHVEVTSLLKTAEGKLCGATMRDELTGDTWDVKSKVVINATGPFCDAVRKMDEPETEEIVAPSSGTHIILPGYYSPQKMGLIDPNTSDGRVIFFLPWQGNTIAGTTDTPTTVEKNPLPTEEEVSWILNEVQNYLSPDINVRRGDVLAAWSGIRPLVRDPKAKNTESLVRNHLIDVSLSGLLTISGGKWTTYRQMAEETVDKAVSMLGMEPKVCKTKVLKLNGSAEFRPMLYIRFIQQFGIETEVARHLLDSYGDRAWVVATMSKETGLRWPVRGVRLAQPYPYIEGEVRYAVRCEYAQTAVDVLARRTRLAFLNSQTALDTLPRVIDIMAEELNWSSDRKRREWDSTVQYLLTMGLPASKAKLSRKDVESGKAVTFETEADSRLYSRLQG